MEGAVSGGADFCLWAVAVTDVVVRSRDALEDRYRLARRIGQGGIGAGLPTVFGVGFLLTFAAAGPVYGQCPASQPVRADWPKAQSAIPLDARRITLSLIRPIAKLALTLPSDVRCVPSASKQATFTPASSP